MEPLGLPRGSVRALVTLIVCLSVCLLMVLERPLPPTLELMISIILGFYFGRRSQADKQEEHHPLYLPFGAVRFLILALFIGTAVWLGTQGRLFQQPVVDVMALILGLFIAAAAKYVLSKIDKEKHETLLMIVSNIKGILVLVVAATIAGLVICDCYSDLDLKWQITMVTFVAFYFGVR